VPSAPARTSLRIAPHVAAALAAGRPVVALESSVIAQGLPIPTNRDALTRMVGAVERQGAVPTISAIVDGTPAFGLDDEELERFLRRDGVVKVSARDFAWAIQRRLDGATTVAATVALAGHAGIRVFATGGIGGVHREAPGAPSATWVRDESADLVELARTSVITVCAGAKSILDLPATVERLETLGVAVVGYRTAEFPGFFTASTGIRVPATVDSAAEIAELFQIHRALGRPGALLVVQAPPPEAALDASEVEGAVAAALVAAQRAAVSGSALTPFLLAAIERSTGGRSLAANVALLEANAALAGAIAVACTDA
jgi:pseudouridylate synthase